MRHIICLATRGWCDIPSRTQQLLGRMRDTKILFFSPEGGDIRPSGQRVRPNVTVYTLPKLFFSPTTENPRLLAFDQARLGKYVEKLARKHHLRDPLLWTTCPQHVHLLPYITYSGLIYDCNQEWDSLPLQWEGKLAHLSDVTFVTSQGLKDRLSPCSDNIAIVPNGVNYPLFSAHQPPAPSPRPIFGWVGRITPDLNLSPLLFAARSHPQWRFMLVGDHQGAHPLFPHLERLSNIKFFPGCSLDEVPSRLAVCHVLMDFNRINSAGSDIVPRRLYEYLSVGAPIVSMLSPDQVELFPDVVYGAHDDVEFLHMCDSALLEAPGFVRDRRKRYGEDAAWVRRVADITQILNTTGFL